MNKGLPRSWKQISFLLLLTFSFEPLLHGQSADDVRWWNPVEHEQTVVEGQAWGSEVESPFDRLPLRAKDNVREAVWGLSKHTAGVLIRFRSNASEIRVRYQVSSAHAMQHMPATGVSGMDLYAIDSDGKWHWVRGQWNFDDTITFRYADLRPNDAYHQHGREYRLYLPLYNQVEWLEVGASESSSFAFLPARREKPIIVYGTSIAQGACASRPGMAWTSILGRKLDRPLINLAFSGNGRLEEAISDLLVEKDPKLYILDCLPNLVSSEHYPDEELRNRILNTVRKLKKAHPAVPILLSDHAGYTDGSVVPNRLQAYQRANRVQQAAYHTLLKEGYSNLYYITHQEFNLQLDDMVDGTHPNDLGMQHYADAYEKVIREILHEPKGQTSTTQACIQYREPDNYDWEERHRSILEMNAADPPKTVILANSIIHFWGGQPASGIVREAGTWNSDFTPAGIRNYAYGWDRIENVLWRVYHGELDGFDAHRVMIMIGTNNLHLNTDEEILLGLEMLLEAVKSRQPQADILLMGILPRRDREERVAKLNIGIAQLAGKQDVSFDDIGHIFLENGKVIERLFSDGLHPNAAGYQMMGEVLRPILID
ncbi:MAG: SGNH/GDSL hydrolase family protein [Saprospiraceae bacterium]|nr:SGNH/GDSL hydrolase family protein [Saprospiraceae bacterium]